MILIMIITFSNHFENYLFEIFESKDIMFDNDNDDDDLLLIILR